MEEVKKMVDDSIPERHETSSHQQLSRRAAKKLRRKQQKAEKKREALDAYISSNTVAVMASQGSVATEEQHDGSLDTRKSTVVGGKATRARLVRQQNSDMIAVFNNNTSSAGEWQQHRPQGGAPILSQILPQHIQIVEFLERKECEMRIRGRGVAMKERIVVDVDCHGSMDYPDSSSTTENNDVVICDDDQYCNLSRQYLRGNFTSFTFTSLPRDTPIIFSSILHLDLSRNELWGISNDALAPLASTLLTLDISRNWFESLPSLGILIALKELKASHNLLKPNSLNTGALKEMNALSLIDLRFNQKCGKQSLLELLQSTLGSHVTVKMTVTYPPPPPPDVSSSSSIHYVDKVGESPAVRDATLLRSQLEPWSTMALRRRLVADFGERCTQDGRSWADEDVSRGQVMDRLLTLYQQEEEKRKSNNSDVNNAAACSTDENGRLVLDVSGTLVEESIRQRVLHALKEFWSNKTSSTSTGNRERPSISAENYMILCSPTMFNSTSQKAAKAACKLKKHEVLWNLAFEAINSVDEVFASQYTAVAVTHNFSGSPHIDKQNTGPFYGFSVGDFEDSTGCIVVECSARVIAKVNTKNRMGKVDGRCPHWVGPYDKKLNRYSLIYYKTVGKEEAIGPAVFSVPSDNVI